jgi:hypothetical protein
MQLAHNVWTAEYTLPKSLSAAAAIMTTALRAGREPTFQSNQQIMQMVSKGTHAFRISILIWKGPLRLPCFIKPLSDVVHCRETFDLTQRAHFGQCAPVKHRCNGVANLQHHKTNGAMR